MCYFPSLSLDHETAAMLNLSHFHVNGTVQTKHCGPVSSVLQQTTHMVHVKDSDEL